MTTTRSIRPKNTWAVVLAAGEGRRLAALCTDERGTAIPKQFCSLNGGSSLLHEALRRARRIVPHRRLCMVVAQQHEPYWSRTRSHVPSANVISEPLNRGTAIGVLHAVMHILDRDPQARIVFLPADHYVRDERRLAQTLRAAVKSIDSQSRDVVLIGISPTSADPDLGYIVPEERAAGPRRVAHFVEKPGVEIARELIARGAVWNSFIFAARGRALCDVLNASMPTLTSELSAARLDDQQRAGGKAALASLYDRLPTVDFSTDILPRTKSLLRVITAPVCGWMDVGHPQRIARIAQHDHKRKSGSSDDRRNRSVVPLINLVAQFARMPRAV